MDSYWREGLHGLSVNEICRRAKISKPGLYRDFGGEDGLMEAALAHYRASVLGPLLEALAADRPFADTLNGLLTWITELHGRPPGCLFFVRMRSAPSRLGPNTSARVEVIHDEMLSAYRAWFERARQRGEVRDGIDADLAALYIYSQLTTALFQMTSGEPPDLIRAQTELAFASLIA